MKNFLKYFTVGQAMEWFIGWISLCVALAVVCTVVKENPKKDSEVALKAYEVCKPKDPIIRDASHTIYLCFMSDGSVKWKLQEPAKAVPVGGM